MTIRLPTANPAAKLGPGVAPAPASSAASWNTVTRNGLISGCYPLDRHYAERPEGKQLKEIKRAAK
jgi:hypothetical protein